MGAALSCVEGTIYNFHADKDVPLRYLYRACLPGTGNPIGIKPISLKSEQIKNYDVSHIIKAHTEYIGKFSELLTYIGK